MAGFEPAENWPLELFRLLVHLYRPHPLTPQVRREEGLGRCIAVDKDRVIADRASQDVRDRTEDGERVLPEQEGRAASVN
jgi:hypothetical protein